MPELQTTDCSQSHEPGANTARVQGPLPSNETLPVVFQWRAIGFIFIAATLLLSVSAMFIFHVTSIRMKAERDVGHQYQVFVQIENFLVAFNQLESAERAYVITGQSNYLIRYSELRKIVDAKLRALRSLVQTGDLQRQQVDRLEQLTRQRLAELENTIKVRRTAGFDPALTAVREHEHTDLSHQIETGIAAMRATEGRELVSYDQRAVWAANLRNEVFFAGCSLNLLFLWWGYRKILRETDMHQRAMNDMACLRRLGLDCTRSDSKFDDALNEIVAAAMQLTRAVKGTMQLSDQTGGLRLAAQIGFDQAFIERGRHVYHNSSTACAQAVRTAKRIVIEDITKNEMVSECVCRLMQSSGVCAVQSTPLISSSGKVLGIISTYFPVPHRPSESELRFVDLLARQAADFLERRHYEQQLQDAHEQLADRAVHLEALVQERTARLNESLGDIESLSYSIVHDMRAPLRAMQSFAQLLAEECGPLNATSQDYLHRIITAAHRLDRLIQDGLSYSRLTRADLPLSRIDLDQLLLGILETYPEFQPTKVIINTTGPFPPVFANVAALTQCVSNLLINAIKFVAPDTVPNIQIWAETRGDRVRLFVKDNGIGIDKAAHEKIFQIFQRLNHKYEGTGIGLAIVKKAVERMGGSVGLQSELGKGSTFWLDLPSAGTRTESKPQQQPQTAHVA